MVRLNEVIKGLKVIDFWWVKTKRSHYKKVRLKCLNCGNEFTKTENALRNGATKCVCDGGYNKYD
jgi:formylmethanofuran dehydrogenase subunit E